MASRRRDRDTSARGRTTLGAWFAILALLCSFLTTSHGQSQQRSLETDRAALERFKAEVDPAGVLFPWIAGTDLCTWAGVGCYEGRVAWLRISGFQLAGPFPATALADLDQLRVLSLHHNRFTGAFPFALGRCRNLQALFLGSNFFSGTLPDFTGLWPRLSHFSVGFNNFTGEIPPSIAALTGLLVLDLQSNAFTGEIPAGAFLDLLRLSVANNNLQGPVPLSLQKFSAESFANNGGLCGRPTRRLCPISTTVTAPVPSPQGLITLSSSNSKLRLKLGVGVIISIAVGGLVAVILVVYILCRPRRGEGEPASLDKAQVGKQVTHYNSGDSNSPEDSPDFKDSFAVAIASEPAGGRSKLQFVDQAKRQEFGLDELLQASAEVLGKGSVGTSYRADLEGNCVVIVKRLKDVAADRKDFETHVEKLGRFRHRHLMPLRAYYFSPDEKLLVSDFIPRGSLHALLHADRGPDRNPLDWVSREKIALGSARGLMYLHKPCVKMPHGNVKSSNVLLSRDYEPFLADYALTPLLNPAHVGASRFIGYRAPEVTDIRKITTHSDVYSFGVLLMELLTGRAPAEAICKNDAGLTLVKWVLSIGRDDWATLVVDPDLRRVQNFVQVEALQMLQLAIACVDAIPERRPKMDEVVLLLEDITQLGHSNESSVCPNAANAQPQPPPEGCVSPPKSSSHDSSTATPLYTRPSSGVFVVGD